MGLGYSMQLVMSGVLNVTQVCRFRKFRPLMSLFVRVVFNTTKIVLWLQPRSTSRSSHVFRCSSLITRLLKVWIKVFLHLIDCTFSMFII